MQGQVCHRVFLPFALTLVGACAPATPAVSTGIIQDSRVTACTRDEFNGNELDRSRWTVVRESDDLRVANGALIIPTSPTDIIFSTATGANIVLQELPMGPYTATTRLTANVRDKYQNAGLVVYADDDNWAKLVLIAGREGRTIEFSREQQGQPEGNWSSETLPTEVFPDSLFLRFVRDTTLRAYYSHDGKAFREVPATTAVPNFANAKIGVLSFAGDDPRVPIIDASFDWFEICSGARHVR